MDKEYLPVISVFFFFFLSAMVGGFQCASVSFTSLGKFIFGYHFFDLLSDCSLIIYTNTIISRALWKFLKFCSLYVVSMGLSVY
jgi:hypothetical protein